MGTSFLLRSPIPHYDTVLRLFKDQSIHVDMEEETQEVATRRRSSVASQHSDTQQHDDDAVISRDATSVRRRLLPVRAFWFTVGIISLGLGGLGIILPGTLV